MTSENTITYLLDQLGSPANIRTRKMFGEYALYCDEKVVALVCDDQLYVKITAAGKAVAGDRWEEGEAYPGAKPSMLISSEHLDDHEWLRELIRVTAAALPPPKPKKMRRSKDR